MFGRYPKRNVPMKTILDFKAHYRAQKPIIMTTCYDACMATLLRESNIDAILVGDSTAMVMHGLPCTVHATLDMMVWHVQMVSRGLGGAKFIVGDMPFLSYHKSMDDTLSNIQQLMQAGAHAVKVEGGIEIADTVKHITLSGVPVMGHIGLTPQAMHQLGGFKVQGKTDAAATQMIEDAKALAQAGCFAIVLECIPSALAKTITEALNIPTIGIGAGVDTSGQILVLQDLLGLNINFKPKFVKQFARGADWFTQGVNAYCDEVTQKTFPSKAHEFTS
jgi:3-methyl-2-oxobutanoate hydroxymethyltransferase